MSTSDISRDRPSHRFSDLERKLSLHDAIADLRSEARPDSGGHRQISLMREGATSLILFAFEAGGELKEHVTDGLVFIHVLRGRVSVSTRGRRHELRASELMFLKPGVPHSVDAADESDVLVSVVQAPPAP